MLDIFSIYLAKEFGTKIPFSCSILLMMAVTSMIEQSWKKPPGDQAAMETTSQDIHNEERMTKYTLFSLC